MMLTLPRHDDGVITLGDDDDRTLTDDDGVVTLGYDVDRTLTDDGGAGAPVMMLTLP